MDTPTGKRWPEDPKPMEADDPKPSYVGDPPEWEKNTITFIASVWKVSTLADGGIRLVLDLEEKAREHMPELARCQQNDIALEIEAKTIDNGTLK